MSKLLYKTIADERPQGKPNVYFSCHPEDFEKYFKEYAGKILRIQDCAIWYESEPDTDYDRDELEMNLSQMQLFVMPVTTKLLTTKNRAMDIEFPLAQEKHIPVLPVMMEHGLDDIFAKRFGDLQYMDPNDTDMTRRSFDEVLESYIKSVIVGSDLANKVRAAFDAYIFLSYRKKDRKKAQELMRLIHRNPVCRDIAIWYDEFLTPGEDFNDAIEKMLEDSDLFALAVTPNLVDEVNYVMTTEYPAALKLKKPVFPVEMEETDQARLEKHYEDLPASVKGEDTEEFREALIGKLKDIAILENNQDPEHNYLIGLAYLDGIDVEVDPARALDLITGSAEAGILEAMQQLVTMYETGKGVKRDYAEGVKWREKYVAKLREAYKSEPSEKTARELIGNLWFLGNAQYELRRLDMAKAAYDEMHALAGLYADKGNSQLLRDLSISYNNLGMIANAQGNLKEASDYFEKNIAINEELFEQSGTVEARREIAVNYNWLGMVFKAQGDLKKAQDCHEKAFAISEELAEQTGTAESRRGVSRCHSLLGNVAQALGNYKEAQEHLEKCLSISEELAEQTGTAEARRDVLNAYELLGIIMKDQGDLERAGDYFEKANFISEELVKETDTIDSWNELSITYYWLGTIAQFRGEPEGARAYYEKGLVINEKLAEQTGTILARRELSNLYSNLGDVARTQGELADALAFYEKALAISEKLAEQAETIESRRELSAIYNNIGLTVKAQGDLVSAQAYYEKDLAISEELAEQTGTLASKNDLAISYNNLGVIAIDQGNLQKALDYHEKALAIIEEAAEQTGSLESRRDLAVICYNIGFLYCANMQKKTGFFHRTDKQGKKRAREMFERVYELGKGSSDAQLADLSREAGDILKKEFR